MLDINLFRADKGGNPDLIRESQRKRGGSVEVVDEIIALDKEWVSSTCAGRRRACRRSVRRVADSAAPGRCRDAGRWPRAQSASTSTS